MKILFTEDGWQDYLYWQDHDVDLLRRINALIKDCSRSPFIGIGKPEPLKLNLKGWWSRRITEEHRLVYRVIDGNLEITQCRRHY